jgi:hypothetical protein
MAKKTTSSARPAPDHPFEVFGTIRDAYQRPLRGVRVQVVDQLLRGERPLGKPTHTDEVGAYRVTYEAGELEPADKGAADVLVRVFGPDDKALAQSSVYYNAAAHLQVDINLAPIPYAGPSEFERVLKSVQGVAGALRLADLREDQNHQDLSFLTGKTGFSQATVTALAMAFRFEKSTGVEAVAYYGLLRRNPAQSSLGQQASTAASLSLETQITLAFATLMRQPIETLMAGLSAAIAANLIPYAITLDLPKLQKAFTAQLARYQKANPPPTAPPTLTQKLSIAGLEGSQVASFVALFSKSAGATQAFWDTLARDPAFQAQQVLLLQAAFTLSQLTGEQMVLTDQLVQATKVKTPADLAVLAAHTSADWFNILQTQKIQPPTATPGTTAAAQLQNYAAELEANFTAAFPGAAFAARLAADALTRVPQGASISQFLQANPTVDLLTARLGQYFAANPPASGSPAAAAAPAGAAAATRRQLTGAARVTAPVSLSFLNQLKRTQRVLKLAPTYAATNALLGDGLDSAQKIYRMGAGNFTAKYGPLLGTASATQVFTKARSAYSQALMLVGNLRSLSDASHLQVFPNYTKILSDAMTVEVPDLDTLFGHTDFCECAECNSVEGAPAYLADALHFLDNRLTSITSGGTTASVKQALGVRRPDIEDLDLSCANTQVELPYIDIANELMEDFIASPSVTLAAGYLPKLVQGPIDANLLAAILSALNAAGFTNVAALLTSNAGVSSAYSVIRLQAAGTFVNENHWVIRDEFVVLKATQQPAGVLVQLTHQTLLTEDEISANPEYTNIPAYNGLKAVKRPFTLPFDLFDTEGQRYLSKLGSAKADLIDAFREEHLTAVTGLPAYPVSPAPTQADLDMAYTYLGVNQGERTLIFQQDLLGQATYWGNVAAGTSAPLDAFMAVTSLTYEQVVQLLTLTTVNPAQDSAISSADLSCDTNTKIITNLTPAKFDIIHRFLRLWRKTTALSLVELDAIVQSPALGNGAIGPALAPQLQCFLTLQGLWSLTAFECLALYQNLDTQAPDSLYDTLFQNRATTNPLNPDFAVSQVTSATPMLITSVHQGLIMGALGLGPADLSALAAQTDGRLSLRNLSYFFRMAQLAQALSLNMTDLFTFLALINLPAVTAAVTAAANPVTSDPVATSQFFQKWRVVVTSQFAANDLNYILRYQSDPTDSSIPSDDDIAQALGDLQTKLLKVQAATQVQPDPIGALLRQWLGDPLLGWNPTLAAKLLDILGTQDDAEFQQKVDNNDDFLLNLRIQYLDGTLTAPLSALPPGVIIPDALASQVSYDAINRQLILIGSISATDQATVLGLSADPSYQAAVNQLYASQTTSSAAANVFFTALANINTTLRPLLQAQIPQRYALFLTAIAPVYGTLQQQSVVERELCSWFKINKDVADALEQSQPSIYTTFTNAAFVTRARSLTAANYPAQFSWYRKLALVCFVATKLQLSATDLQWLLPNAAKIGSLDLWSLPTAAVSGPVSTIGAFGVLVGVLTFNQQFPPVTEVTTHTSSIISLYSVFDDVIGGAALPSIESDLSTLTGWDGGALDQLINAPNLLNLTLTPSASSDLLSVRILLRLARCFQVIKGLGAAPADCVAWTKPSLTYDDAVKIKQALQAKVGADQWPSITRPLQDALRQTKRDALVAYLLANPPAGESWLTVDDLYAFFLIDVEMCSCQPTSRIIQATNSIQQFVQRSFLNLEQDILVDLNADPDWSQWEWMKNYRVWQANREIFLYPENYIQPELLPVAIKSPFFADLQNKLLQNDVTNDNVQSAFLSYLDSLDQVSRLEMKAMWYEDEKRILHVVGRTYGGNPKTYYYRQLVNERRWTPWVKIDQDVASDHVVLTVFNHRVYLFWALFKENSEDVTQVSLPKTGDSSYTPDRPTKYWQIQLAFSEYKNGKWTPKKVSNDDATGTLPYYETWDGSSWSPIKEQFLFTPLDLPQLDFKKYFNPDGTLKNPATFLASLRRDIITALEGNGDLIIRAYVQASPGEYFNAGAFELDPCKGYPVVAANYFPLRLTLFDQSSLSNMLDLANEAGEALAVHGGTILGQTVGRFDNLVSLQMGFIDRLINVLYQILYGLFYRAGQFSEVEGERTPVSVGTFMPYVYQDKSYTYYVRPEFSDNDAFEFTDQDLEDLILALLEGNSAQAHQILATFPRGGKIALMQHFFNLYHPLVCFFMRTLFDSGLDALMSRDTQLKNDVIFDPSPSFDFRQTYAPSATVYSGQPVTYTLPSGPVTDPTPGYPKGDVDFTPVGGYSLYNWELFFHAPLMIARRLDQNLKYADADHWFRYIFNPTDGSSYPAPDKYWVTKPFFENVNDKYTQQKINNIMLGIDQGDAGLVQDVTDWRNNPFQPHYIAAYRTVAYQKTTVMNYLDHLIAWGDNLFQQDSMESVMEAEQLYVLAAQILGPEPLIIPPSYQLPIDNYDQLQQSIDAFSNALVDVENLLPLQQIQGYQGVQPSQGMPVLATLYFCIPPNAQLLEYWNTVGNRLFNIRHCLNKQGQLAPLALMAPPINPMLLVRAAAAGLDIGSVLADLNSPLPNYRFAVMLQKAVEICNEAKSLGAALLQAMEKKDAEDLALLRSQNGLALLQAVLTLKQSQVIEATHNLEALQAQQALIQVRIKYYQGLIQAGLSGGETAALLLTQSGIGMEQSGVAIEYLGNILALIPDFDLGASGFGGTPLVAAKFGGTQLGGATRAMAAAIRGTAGTLHSQAGVASTQAGYQRRSAEWQFQLDLANAELAQVQKQILAVQVRLDISNQDVTNQQLQITNAQSEDDFMHQKFTNTDLYAWMIGQLSQIYFQGYQLAYAWAKQAEQTFQYELGVADSSFVVFGYWNSLQKGLLAADSLMASIRSMDKAYHDQNAREYELTKHISLAQLDPAALEVLKVTGSCWFSLPEELFDLDYPGYYMRRIRNASLTLPCVAGPYTTVSCKLTMTRNSVRVSSSSTGAATYPRKRISGAPADDPRFRDAVGAIQSIATSSGQNDAGLFEVNFHDERYLPFEGAGAISQWHLELPAPYPQFDYRTLSDVVVHLKYTARDGGAALAADAATSLKTKLNAMIVGLSANDVGLMRGFSARHEFPTAWYAFLNPPSATADQELDLDLTPDRFPYFASAATIKIQSIELIADTALTAINGLAVTPVPTNAPLNLIQDNAYGMLPRLVLKYSGQSPGTWVIKNPVANPRLIQAQLNDLIVIVHYQVS